MRVDLFPVDEHAVALPAVFYQEVAFGVDQRRRAPRDALVGQLQVVAAFNPAADQKRRCGNLHRPLGAVRLRHLEDGLRDVFSFAHLLPVAGILPRSPSPHAIASSPIAPRA
jgi:hypothetical protein